MPSNERRLHEAMRHIDRIKAGDYPAIVGNRDDYRIVERPWAEIAEPSKLAILKDAVDWSEITNRDQAHILLSQIDPGKIPDAERNRLIDTAEDRLSLKDFRETSVNMEGRQRTQERDRGIER
jgi:hypothetical protein